MITEIGHSTFYETTGVVSSFVLVALMIQVIQAAGEEAAGWGLTLMGIGSALFLSAFGVLVPLLVLANAINDTGTYRFFSIVAVAGALLMACYEVGAVVKTDQKGNSASDTVASEIRKSERSEEGDEPKAKAVDQHNEHETPGSGTSESPTSSP